jgi:predicted cation transporter
MIVMVLTGLVVILGLVLLLPFLFRRVEENLELFLFIMGICAALISGIMDFKLIMKALEEPIMIALAVLVAGLLFHFMKDRIARYAGKLLAKTALPVVVFAIIFGLGLISSVITAIIAAIILVELIALLPLKKEQKTIIAVIACFSIGLGATLTPIGEPLATIAISKLNKDFFYLLGLLGWYIIPATFALALAGALYTLRYSRTSDVISSATPSTDIPEASSIKETVIRALKVYLFVMALVFLGEGFQPLINAFIINLDCRLLYWVNTVSAVLDNATLTAAEVSSKMTTEQVKAILMGLLISGGMLVPGNIPNIVCASRLKISSRDWAKIGLPIGFVLMAFYFVVLF